MLIKTITESGGTISMIGIFGVFMLCVLTIVAGHTMGRCLARGESVIWTDNDSNDSKVTM